MWAAVDDDAIRALVTRLARPHPSGGEVIERAAILAEGADFAAVMAWITAHDGIPEAQVAKATSHGLHGSRLSYSAERGTPDTASLRAAGRRAGLSLFDAQYEPNDPAPCASLPAVSRPRLSETSYIVLGLLEHVQPATPYDLKRLAERSTVHFWAVPHTQLYAECARLAKEGLLTEEREQTGRRRRIYRVTELGHEALESWRAEPIAELEEVRDLGILKLFFGADPATLAASYLEAHEDRLRKYEEMHATDAGDVPRGAWLALEAGLGHEREYVRFWKALRDDRAD